MADVQIITSIDGDELWSRIWGSEPQSFGSHWRALEYRTGDWQHAGQVRVVLEDPYDLEGSDATVIGTITLDKIVKALNNLQFPSHLRDNIMQDNADCIDSDAVIQFIMFGEVVYG